MKNILFIFLLISSASFAQKGTVMAFKFTNTPGITGTVFDPNRWPLLSLQITPAAIGYPSWTSMYNWLDKIAKGSGTGKNYDSVITAMKADISGIQASNQQLKDSITNLNIRISELANRPDPFQPINTLDAKINGLQQAYDTLPGLKFSGFRTTRDSTGFTVFKN